MSVSNLSVADCIVACHQAFNSKNFKELNPHLTVAQTQQLKSTPIFWPTVPVLSPYAATKVDGYSQIRFEGVKYFIHRVAFKAHHGIDPPASDVSHRVYLGDLTTRYVESSTLRCAEYANIVLQKFQSASPLFRTQRSQSDSKGLSHSNGKACLGLGAWSGTGGLE